jgi:hypothetical protein
MTSFEKKKNVHLLFSPFFSDSRALAWHFALGEKVADTLNLPL